MAKKLKQPVLTILRLIPDKNKAKHRDYDHVVEYVDTYTRPLTTGKNIGPLVHRFNKRETEGDHEQRIRLTVATSPAIINKTMGPVRKIPRVKPNVNRADFGLERKEDTAKLAEAEGRFFAGKSVAHWLGSVALDYGAIDPNAFCLISFDDFDARYESPRAYPTLISCKDAWNFEYANGDLQWLLVHRDITYIDLAEQAKAKKAKATDQKPKTKAGHWFCLYLPDHHVVFTQVDPTTIADKVEGLLIEEDGIPLKGFEPGSTVEPEPAMAQTGRYYYRVSKEELYAVTFYEHLSGRVQAFRMGWKLDQETDGRTLVSCWHSGMPYLLKGIKAGSELDISASLHAFLKEYSYGPRCLGYTDRSGEQPIHLDCNGGTDPGGHKCKACDGSGMFRISSGQDHVTLPLPPRGTELADLSKMHHYAELDVATLEWQDKYVDKVGKLVYESVYNSEPLSRDQVQPTATAELKDNENVYDTLQPGCSWYAEAMVLIRELIATYTVKDRTGFVNQYQFPRNLRFESIGDLVALQQALKTAGASAALMVQVQGDIMDHLFVDDERALQRAKAMVSFDPFAGKDEATIVSLISQDLTTKELKVFWTNMAYVFAEAEERTAKVGMDFYELTRTKQQELLDEIVGEMITALKEDDTADAGGTIGAAERSTLGTVPEPTPGGGTPNPQNEPDVQ